MQSSLPQASQAALHRSPTSVRKDCSVLKGEILIERQIEQLREAGVEEIYIVVGYMKEKFFYLERKYPGVKLIVNNKFGVKILAKNYEQIYKEN